MRLTSIFILLSAALAFTARGDSITVNVTVDSHLESVSLSADKQTMGPVGRNGSATWTAWSADTAYTPAFSGVATGYTARWKVTVNGAEVLSGGSGNSITLQQSHAGCTLSFYGEPNTYAITFDRQSGSGGTASATATYGAPLPAITPPTRTGYEFCSYTTAPNGAGVQYYNADGTSVTNWNLTSDATLYAQWKASEQSITFDRQLGSGGTTNVTATYGLAMPTITIPSRSGYTFCSYTTAPNGGGTTYYNADGSSARTWDKTEATTLYAYWAVITNTVFLNPQGGTDGSTSVTATYASPMPPIKLPVRPGFKFHAYCFEPGGGMRYYNAKGASARKWDQTSDTTLYAQWLTGTYAVFLDQHGGSNGTESVTATYGEEMPPITIPTRPGYDFSAYTTAPNGSGIQYYNADGTSARTWDITSNATLHAQWMAGEYSVTLNPQGGSGGTESVTATYGAAMPTNGVTMPARSGYGFLGFYEFADGGGAQYYNADGSSAGAWNIVSNATLYANWAMGKYSVTLDQQGGNGGTRSIMATYDAPMPTNGVTMPLRTGYAFGGYYEFANGAGTQYYNADGTSARLWNVASNATLYANWATNSYIVQFNGNGGSGVMPDLSCAYNLPARLPTNAFTNAGYAFAGWATSESGSVVYGDGAVVTNLAATGTVPLYAKWTARTYEVGYDNLFFLCEFAANAAACESMSESGSVSVDAGTAGTVVISASDGVADAEISSRYARTDLVTAGMHSFPVEGGESYTISCTLNKRNGDKPAGIGVLFFDASGGYIDPNGAYSEEGGESRELTAPSSAAHMALFFKAKCTSGESVAFSKIKVCKTLPYSLVSNSAVRKTFTYGPSSKYGSLAIPTRTGYTFRWWDNGEGTEVSGETTVRPECTTLFSTWAAKEYPVKLDPQGGTGGTTSVTATYGAAMPMADMPTLDGYTFGGYYTNPNGDGTQYYTAAGTSARPWDMDKTGVTTLYAYWIANAPEEPITYTVTLNPQGGSGGTETVTVTNGVAMPTITPPTRDGYDFCSYTNATGTVYYNADGTSAHEWDLASNATLYASWSLKPKEPDPLAEAVDAPDLEFTTFGTFGASGQFNETRTNYEWFAQTDFAYDGTSAAQSHALPVSSSDYQVYCSWLTTTVEGKGVLSFWWKCAAKPRQSYDSSTGRKKYGDIFRFGVCDEERFEQVEKLEGSSDWVQGIYTNNTDGKVTLAWVFTYADYAGRITSNGGGTGWVDRVEWKPFSDEPPDEPEPLYNTYTVTLDSQGGSGGTETVTATNGIAMPTITPPTRAGYEFCSYTNSAGTSYYNADGSSARTWDKTSDATLYAYWTGTVYKVTFDDGSGAPSTSITYGDPIATIPERTGYTFGGYFTQPNGGGTKCYDADGNMESVDEATISGATLHAYWVPIEYMVTLEPSPGTGGTLSITATYGIAMPIITPPTRAGYEFCSYTNSAGTSYYNADGTSAHDWDLTFATTLYAYWTGMVYKVTFDDGSGAASSSITYGDPLAIPSLEGYTFGGYFTQPNGGGTKCYDADGNMESVDEATISGAALHAYWVPIEYTVTLEPSPGAGGTLSTTATYGEALSTITIPSRPGYEFCSYTNSAGTSYYNADGTSAHDWDLTSATTLYAQWNPNTYAVAFNSNGGEGEMENQTFTYDAVQNLNTVGFNYSGHTFTGWSTNSTDKTIIYTNCAEVVNIATGGVFTLYAQWVEDTPAPPVICYVTLNQNHPGAGEGLKGEVKYGVVTNHVATQSRTGYEFCGYFRDRDGDYQYFDKNGNGVRPWDIVTNATIYAHWKPRTYELTFSLEDGSGSTTNVMVTYDAAMPSPIPKPERVGYIFNGYFSGVNGHGTQYYDADGISTNIWTVTSRKTIYAYWIGKPYTMTFDANGGDGDIGDLSSTNGTSTALSPNVFTRRGYTFMGWATTESGEVVYGDGVNITDAIDGTMKLYAVWEPYKYTISFDSNGGSDTMDPMTCIYDVPTNLTACAFTFEGYGFVGWATNGADGVVFADKALVTNLTATDGENVKLYAQWDPNVHTVAFAPGEGSGTMASMACTYGVPTNLTDCVFTRTGYAFAGWATTADGDAEFADGASYTLPNDDNQTLFAKWTPNQYTISFNANGGTGDPIAPMSCTYDVPMNLTTCTFERTGYAFAGWTTNGADGVVFADGAAVSNLTVEAGADVELLACWTANAYTVKFNANDGTGSISDMPCTYGTEANLTSIGDSLERTGYTFAGWATTADGDVAYSDGASVSNLTAEVNGTVTLFAKWTPNQYMISFDANAADATGNMESMTCTYDVSMNLTTCTFERTGYAFAGWTTNGADGVVFADGAAVSNLAAMAGADVELLACWTANAYTVKFDVNDGTGSMSDMPCTYGIEANLTTIGDSLSRTGYTFAGWATTADGEVAYSDGASVSNLTAEANGTVTLFAKWTPNQYTISFNANGGTGDPMAPMSCTYDVSANLTACAFDCAGYGFAGWTTNGADGVVFTDGAAVSNLAVEAGADVELIACWTANAYTVKFNANDGTGGISDMSCTYGTEANLTSIGDSLVRTGYTFAGWATSADGEVEYADGANISNLTAEANGTVILFAKWTANEYTISFNANGGTGDMAPMSCTYDVPTNLTTCTFKRAGYGFAGWTTNGADGVVFTGGAAVSNLAATAGADVELIAQWTAYAYTVKFDANDGTGSISDMSCTYDTEANLTTIGDSLVRTGYTFSGWATSADGDVAYSDGASISNLTAEANGTVTLFAQWSQNHYTISFDRNGGTAGNMDPMACTYDVPANLTSCTFERTGYDFVGWTTNGADGAVQFLDGALVTNLTAAANETVAMYACWTATTHTVSVALAEAVDAPELDFKTKGTVGNNGNYNDSQYDASWSVQSNVFCYGASAVQSGALPMTSGDVKVYVSWLTTTVEGRGVLSFWWKCAAKSRAQSLSLGKLCGNVFRFGRYVGEGDFGELPEISSVEGNSDWQCFTYTNDVDSAVTFAWAFTYIGGVQNRGGGTGYVDRVTWSKGYTVTLDQQGGSGGTESVMAICDAPLPTITIPNREGYTFDGYYTAANGGGDKYYNAKGTSAANWNIAADTTLYAAWTAKSYTVTLDPQNGGGTSATNATYDAALPTVPVPAREGYAFGGYTNEVGTLYYDENGGGLVAWDTDGDTTLFAAWTANPYTVTFDANGGTGDMAPISCTYDMPTNLTPCAFTRIGYGFASWTNSVGDVFLDGALVSNLTATANDTVTLYAKWTATTYTVTLDPQNGNGASTTNATYDADMPTVPVPEREGYAFGGYTNSTGTAYYNADGTSARPWDIDTDGAVTLYAAWTANPYTVTFNANGGTGDMAPMSCTYDVPTNLTPCAFTRTGYGFASWTNSVGDVFLDGALVSNLTATANDTVTLYAKWTAVTYTVTLDPRNGNGTSTTNATYDADMPTVPVPTRTGYAFNGYTNSTGTAYYNADGTSARPWDIDTDGTVTLYAAWTPNHYTISFDANAADATGNMESMTCTYDVPTNLTACAFNRTGYGFAGWTTNGADGVVFADKAPLTNLAATDGENVKLYAQWDPNVHTVAFDPGEGSGTMASMACTYGVPMNLTDCVFTRTGYTFAGWATTADGDAEFADGASYTLPDDGDQTLYATWTGVVYTVSFNANGGTGAMASMICTYDVQTNLTPCAFTRTGYDFASWTNSAGDVFLDGALVSNLTATANDTVTLYAKWTAKSYTVTLDPQNGGGTSTTNATYDADMPTVPVPLRTGYDFGGYTNSTGTAYYDADGTSARTWDADGAATLYAVWTAKSYTVTLDPQNGGGTSTTNATYDADMPTVPVPLRTGYAFGGYTNSAGMAYYNSDGTSARTWDIDTEGATTLYAVWTANAYTVTLDPQNGGVASTTNATYDAALPTITPPTRTGYTFGGYTNSTGMAYYNADGTSARDWDADGATTLYAVWTAKSYTVTLDPQNGSTASTMNATYDAALPTITPPTRTGYTFGGYTNEVGTLYYNADGTSARPWDIDTDGATTLYAVWTAKSYTVTLDPRNGGGTSTTNATYDADMPTVPVPLRTGYDFGGYTNSAGTAYYTASGTSARTWDADGAATLYAAWIANQYTISFNANAADATGTMLDQSCTYDLVSCLTSNAFTRTGYDFAGWTNNVGDVFLDGALVSNLTATANGTVTLYAQWVENGYTVTLDAGDGVGFMTNSVGDVVSVIADFPVAIGGAWNLPTAVTNINPDLAFAGWAHVNDGVTNSLPSVVPPLSEGVTNLVVTWGGALAVAVDAPGLEFKTKGTFGAGKNYITETEYIPAKWSVQKNCGYDGSDAVQGVALPPSTPTWKVYVSWLTTTVEGKGVLSFSWKRDAQDLVDDGDIYGDVLRFGKSTDSGQFTDLSLEVPNLRENTGWQNVTYTNNQDGPVTFAWAFTYRDSDWGNGGGTGYVDRVTWTPSE